MSELRMPVLDHLRELRRRLIYALAAVGLGMFGALAVAERIQRFLQAPVLPFLEERGLRFVVLSPIEQPLIYLKLAFFTGLAAAVPVILYQGWRFIAPGLYAGERRFMTPLIVFGTLFFLAGMAFAYLVVIPLGLTAALGFLPAEVTAMLSIDRYTSLVIWLLLGCGLIFETPLVVALLVRSGLVPLAVFQRNRKYAIVVAFVVVAALPPSDPWTLIAMALPLIVFYELGLLIGRLWRPAG